MANSMTDDQKRQAEQMVANAARVSNSIREALQASLPVAPEQLMTVQVPGVVIDCSRGGPYWWNSNEHSETPHNIKVNEARLVDGMIPLSKLMLGPTGKSVARSYAAALDMLIPQDAPIDTDTSNQSKSKTAERYRAAMKYLTSIAPNSTKTVIDMYVEKQQAWSDVMKEWNKAKAIAHDISEKLYPNDRKHQQQHFDNWHQHKIRAQAKYMDWIVNGCKYSVDYHFGVVDVSSAMKRVESSKEASRNLVVIDPDGTTEWQQVVLDPPNWANDCLEKVTNWGKTKNTLNRKDYETEIKRMKRFLLSYKGLEMSLGPVSPEAPSNTEADTNPEAEADTKMTSEEKKLQAAYTDLYKVQAKKDATVGELKTAQEAVQSALEEQGKASLAMNKQKVDDMAKMSRSEKQKWIARMIKDTEEQIGLLEEGLRDLNKISIAVPAIKEVTRQTGDGADLMRVNYAEANDRWADRRFGLPRDDKSLASPAEEPNEANKWTKITVSISATKQESEAKSQSSSTSASVSGGWGLFSASGGISYSQASSNASQSAASCNVEISFEALLVTINRAWLHGELFADQDLNVAPDVVLSPGPSTLKEAIEARDTKTLQDYSYFPSYPTAFILAANVELEFRGDTTQLEEAIESSSLDANLKVGYGPFSLNASHKQDKSSAKTKMETTATGTRISLEAPAIIGWVSTLLPELPRKKDDPNRNSLVQPFIGAKL